MHAADTILAHASAPGQSARAIVRVSGGAVGELCAIELDVDPENQATPHRRTFTARLKLPGASRQLSLPVLATRFIAPASYTGEDVLELQIPGNPHLLERVVAALLASGVAGGRTGKVIRLAHPGEFTARAYFNRKLTLDQAEGVAATIAARTAEQLDASRQLLTGQTGEAYRALAEECATLLALVESGIDFTDQDDVVPIAPALLHQRVTALRTSIGALQGTGRTESVSALPRVTIVGRPNAGKSTLFNALLGRRRAVESPLAGTTRDVLEETLDLSKDALGTGPILLMDLPGLDLPAASACSSSSSLPSQSRGAGVPPVPTSPSLSPPSPNLLAQVAARDALLRADALLWCDPRGRFESDLDLSAMGLTRDLLTTRPVVRVRTFADRLDLSAQTNDGATGNASEDESSENRSSTGNVAPAIAICALDGWNLPTLRRALADAACAASAGHLAALLPRHRLALARAQSHLHEANHAIDPAAKSLAAPELVADSLRAALDQLGELVGHISPDDVLGRVFATFCVGK